MFGMARILHNFAGKKLVIFVYSLFLAFGCIYLNELFELKLFVGTVPWII